MHGRVILAPSSQTTQGIQTPGSHIHSRIYDQDSPGSGSRLQYNLICVHILRENLQTEMHKTKGLK